ncbi:NAD-dependent epimerase/dehydratase family protein [Rhodopila sp.]|jgi:dTDP-L-rhamnose 4-epimerase|uniref:NAD-dependent epimerase/dehydratase family protein n=1 Tax=Rhodopila sp. TaxID=2480087 RepID=UPI002BFB1D30|nr:NAD-dependent epimerase/dehydratase family protein [Rhodopila sp.]HVZ07491.1 NAD-dependent epimerase/dehydratase family protein [Rhodopila sp.]
MARTYLVTGGAGFIGRHLVRELLDQGHRVRVLDSMLPQVHGTNGVPLPNDVGFVRGDIRDPRAVARALEGADGVFHLAAEVGVGQSMYEIARYTEVNDLGTAVLLEQLARKPVERLIVASSMSVYGEGAYRDSKGALVQPRRKTIRGDNGWEPLGPDDEELTPVPVDERKPVDLASIYALTKYNQERGCLIVGRAYGMQVATLRLFNVFGPGQALGNPYTGVLANFGARLLNGARPLVFEDGRQKRDFVHVRDVARAFRLTMESASLGEEVINIGSGHAYAIADVATMLARAMGMPDRQPEILGKARAGDIRHCFADIARARSHLGFAPRFLLEDSLDELVDWIVASEAEDRGEDARRQLELRGLVA